jgi:hypothetical protein
VLLDQGQRIVSLYQQAGLNARLITLRQAGHGGKAFFTGDHFETARMFLDSECPSVR